MLYYVICLAAITDKAEVQCIVIEDSICSLSGLHVDSCVLQPCGGEQDQLCSNSGHGSA